MIRLVLGGARSGKSEAAEAMAGRGRPPVTYVATAVAGDDADLAARIARHRARRPAWETVEVPLGGDLAAAVRPLAGTAVVDSLGTWLAGCHGFRCDAAALLRALGEAEADVIVVSDEVGMGVHPETEAGRHFRDALGTLNRSLAGAADDVVLVVAGRLLRLPAP